MYILLCSVFSNHNILDYFYFFLIEKTLSSQKIFTIIKCLFVYIQYVEYIDSNKNKIKHKVKCVDFMPLTICSL